MESRTARMRGESPSFLSFLPRPRQLEHGYFGVRLVPLPRVALLQLRTSGEDVFAAISLCCRKLNCWAKKTVALSSSGVASQLQPTKIRNGLSSFTSLHCMPPSTWVTCAPLRNLKFLAISPRMSSPEVTSSHRCIAAADWNITCPSLMSIDGLHSC